MFACRVRLAALAAVRLPVAGVTVRNWLAPPKAMLDVNETMALCTCEIVSICTAGFAPPAVAVNRKPAGATEGPLVCAAVRTLRTTVANRGELATPGEATSTRP